MIKTLAILLAIATTVRSEGVHGHGYVAPLALPLAHGHGLYAPYGHGVAHGHGLAYAGHGLAHGYGHGLAHGYGHGLAHPYGHGLAHTDYAHGHAVPVVSAYQVFFTHQFT